jgi:hypothetical protein
VRGQIERGGPVQHAAVVPQQQFALGPAMLVRQVGVNDHGVEFLNQHTALVVGQTEDVFRMVAEIDAFASGFRVRANDRVVHRWAFALLRLGHQVLAVATRA